MLSLVDSLAIPCEHDCFMSAIPYLGTAHDLNCTSLQDAEFYRGTDCLLDRTFNAYCLAQVPGRNPVGRLHEDPIGDRRVSDVFDFKHEYRTLPGKKYGVHNVALDSEHLAIVSGHTADCHDRHFCFYRFLDPQCEAWLWRRSFSGD